MNKQHGFTLIELLVVIAIIAILMAILMPALQKVRQQARKQTCATRIRQHVLALNMYADENTTKLPLPAQAFYWLQDLAIPTVNFMLDAGLTREIFYCPSNHNHQKYNDLFWKFMNKHWNGRKFTTEDDYIVSGYCYILETSGAVKRPEITPYENDPIKKIWLKTTQESHPALREVVVDSIMGERAPAEKYGWDFAQVAGGIWNESQVYDQTSHLKGNDEPEGGNVGFLDGHTEWRHFEPDIKSGSAVPRYGGTTSPGFFW